VLLEAARLELLAPRPAWQLYATALLPPLATFATLALLRIGLVAAGLSALAAGLAALVGTQAATLAALLPACALTLDRFVLHGRVAGCTRRLDDAIARANHLDRAAGLAVAAVAFAFAALSIAQHARFDTAAYDLGLFDQWIWLISRGLPPYGTGVGTHALGDHAALILYPLALLYAVVPDVRALLVFQALVVALGAVPLYLIGRARGAAGAGLVAALAFLAHPGTHNLTLFDFHPDAIAGSALLLALLGWELRRTSLIIVGCGLALACKENFAVTVAFFGLWIAAHRSWRLGIGLFAAGVVWFVLTTQLILPELSGQTQSVFVSRFGQYGASPGEIVLTLLAQPQRLFADLFGPQDLRFLWETLAPLGLLPLFSPRTLALALPATVLNLLSSFAPQQTITYHYTALMVPLACVALLHAIIVLGARLERVMMVRSQGAKGLRSQGAKEHTASLSQPQRWAGLVLLACALAVVIGSYSVHTTTVVRTWALAEVLTQNDPRPRVRAYVLAQIPSEARVAAQTWLHPHLSQRRQVFVFPNPFRHVYLVNPSAAPEPLAADYIVYDLWRPDNTAGSFDGKVELLELLQRRGLYRPVVELDGVTLFRRTDASLPISCFGVGWEDEGCVGR
jgi:uncharacterized membrane protein